MRTIRFETEKVEEIVHIIAISNSKHVVFSDISGWSATVKAHAVFESIISHVFDLFGTLIVEDGKKTILADPGIFFESGDDGIIIKQRRTSFKPCVVNL